jgi:hypothetical protein
MGQRYKNTNGGKMKKPSGLPAGILLLFAVLFACNEATAGPSVYQFAVTGITGPLAGVTSVGTFAFDPTIAPEGGGFVEIAGLFTHLSFSWDGVDYDEDTANTGTLGFEADGTLIYALFGTDCGPSGFGCGVGNDPNPKQWSFDIYYGTGAFYYFSPTDPSDIFVGTVSLTALSSPTDKNQCKKGGWQAYAGPNGPFKNQGDCIQYVNTGK